MYHLDTTEGASMMAVMWVGVAVGSLLIGMCSERMGKRCFPLGLFASIGFVAAIALIYFKLPLIIALFLLFFLGLGTSGQSLSFAVIRDINHPKRVATAMGVNNFSSSCWRRSGSTANRLVNQYRMAWQDAQWGKGL